MQAIHRFCDNILSPNDYFEFYILRKEKLIMSFPTPPLDLVLGNLQSAYQARGWPCQVMANPIIRQLPWSTLFFVTLETGRIVVKIVHFPDQTTAEISWQAEELLQRGQREYETMVKLEQHFEGMTDFHTIHPILYLKEINAIVMEHIDAVPVHHFYPQPDRLWRMDSNALQTFHQAGAWLAHFHRLPLQLFDPHRQHHPQESLATLLTHQQHLEGHGVHLTTIPYWEKALERLSQITETPYCWAHGDFHMRNILRQSDGRLIGFDTALELIESPAYDLGKFLADLQTRKERLVTGLPGLAQIAHLRQAFLEGYGPLSVSSDLLALYEGRFMLQKWKESLEALPDALKFALGKQINRVMRQNFREWAAKITQNIS